MTAAFHWGLINDVLTGRCRHPGDLDTHKTCSRPTGGYGIILYDVIGAEMCMDFRL